MHIVGPFIYCYTREQGVNAYLCSNQNEFLTHCHLLKRIAGQIFVMCRVDTGSFDKQHIACQIERKQDNFAFSINFISALISFERNFKHPTV